MGQKECIFGHRRKEPIRMLKSKIQGKMRRIKCNKKYQRVYKHEGTPKGKRSSKKGKLKACPKSDRVLNEKQHYP